MSFLPYASTDGPAWLGSMGLSAVAHTGIASFVLLTGAVSFDPQPQIAEVEEASFSVTLEILDADVIEDIPVLDELEIPEDAPILTPELEEDALAPETDSLIPDEQAALEPEEILPEPAFEPEAIAPELDATLPDAPTEIEAETPVIDDTAPEPEIVEVTPQINEPITDDYAVADPEVAPIEPEIAPQPLTEEIAQPIVVEEQPFLIEDEFQIEDNISNPLAEGGLAPEPEIATNDLALALPEPSPVVPEPSIAAVSSSLRPPARAPIEDQDSVLETSAPIEPAETLTPADEPADASEPIILEPTETEDPIDLAALPPTDVADPDATLEPSDTALEPSSSALAPSQPRLSNPSASQIAVAQLLRRVRVTASDPCTLALPRRSGNGAGLSLVGEDVGVLNDLADRIIDGLDPAPAQSREIIDGRQCAALDALRQTESYPANRLGLSLNSVTLSSGESLEGRVLGAGGLFLTLLMIDDNGVVQDLAPFVTLDGDVPVFDAPVARSGPSRETRGILMALGTTDAPLDLSETIGQTAQDVFASIPAEQLAGTVFGFATFDVR